MFEVIGSLNITQKMDSPCSGVGKNIAHKILEVTACSCIAIIIITMSVYILYYIYVIHAPLFLKCGVIRCKQLERNA